MVRPSVFVVWSQAVSNAGTHVLVVSDNIWIEQTLGQVIASKHLDEAARFDFVCSPNSPLEGKTINGKKVSPIALKTDYEKVLEGDYQLVISAHSKQIFPEALVKAVRCVNVHPGLIPYNRGWFPQVFSILNGLPLGATIHEMDAEIDHGRIIDQEPVPLFAWDTSETAYDRVQKAERTLLERSLEKIITGSYIANPIADEGNINYKKDVAALCCIDLDETVTFKEAIDRLRALSHGDFKNAYFIDPDTGQRVFVRISLELET